MLHILVDDREKLPYSFASVRNPTPFRVSTAHLSTGDYSLAPRAPLAGAGDLEPLSPALQIVVERKSLADLYGTIARHRRRFEREFRRLSDYGYAAVVIEATWEEILAPNDHLRHPTRLNPRSVANTLISWSQRYGVHIWPGPGRRFGEQMTFRLLEKWARNLQRG